MTHATHTPGPWLPSLNPVASLGYMIGAPVSHALPPESARHIGNVYSEANARLIAAAPEPLAALEFAESVCGEDIDAWITEENLHVALRMAATKARAAIAKARGQA